jgi:hypothetical protein
LLTTGGPQQQQQIQFQHECKKQQGHCNRVDANNTTVITDVNNSKAFSNIRTLLTARVLKTVGTPAISGMSTTEGKPKYCGNNRKRKDINNRIKQPNAICNSMKAKYRREASHSRTQQQQKRQQQHDTKYSREVSNSRETSNYRDSRSF